MHACCSCVVLDRFFFFFSSRRRHTRWPRDWSSDVCSSDLGTSIIHGIAASRAGMSLPAILGRRLGRDVVGLGFSGNGKMETAVAELLAEIDAAVYVVDCLPNMDADLVRGRSEERRVGRDGTSEGCDGELPHDER